MTNPLAAIKIHTTAKKLYKEIARLEKKNKIDYKWFVLGIATGYVTTISDITSPYKIVEEMKKQYPRVAEAPATRSTPRRYDLEWIDDDKKDCHEIVKEKAGGEFVYDYTGKPFTLFEARDIKKCGYLLNSETQEEMLNDMLYPYKDTIQAQAKAVLGEYWTEKIFHRHI